MKYLITGKNGQLANEFIHSFEKSATDYTALDEHQLDITSSVDIEDAFASVKPDVLINCAAYNFVDKSEENEEAAFHVNAIGTRLLSRAARKYNSLMLHFSSDYVFDGSKEQSLYTEDDTANPLNVYGRSKLQGEEFLIKETDRYLIMRLSWVFGNGDQNFITKLLSWEKNQDFLKVACDEFSVPTYTGTVVDISLKAIEQGVTGLFHLTNTGYCSRYEWARHIFSSMGITKFIRPVTMESFNLPALRPLFSAMSNSKIAGLLGIEIPHWQKAVNQFLLRRADK